jgi:hypothetical protein
VVGLVNGVPIGIKLRRQKRSLIVLGGGDEQGVLQQDGGSP